MSADLQAQLAEARDDLANAVCTCGHRAEWHSALIGCNAEEYTADAKPCDCRCDWLDAIMPTLAALVSAHVAQVREELANDVRGWINDFTESLPQSRTPDAHNAVRRLVDLHAILNRASSAPTEGEQ